MTPAPILYVHHRSELGGAPGSLAYVISELDRDRFDPHVFCPPGPATDLFREVGATVHEGPVSPFTHIWASRYSGRRWLLFARDIARLPAHVHAFRRVLAVHAFSIIHLNDSPLLASAVIAHRQGIPIVWHLRSALPEAHGRLRSRLIRRTIKRLARTSISINADVAASFNIGSEVIPNSLDLTRFHPGDPLEARRALGLPVALPAVGFFGFIYPSKGYSDAIDAVGVLARRGVKVTLLIVGGGVRSAEFFTTRRGRAMQALGFAQDHQQDAADRVRELGLESSVRFMPFTHKPELVYRACDVVIAPSRGPELGRPVLEAAATGRPVVASGSRDGAGLILPEETGLLVPSASPSELARALESLLRDETSRAQLGAKARKLAESEFDSARNAGRVMDIYDRILSEQRTVTE